MATSFGALCTDFYINQKLTVRMDLPNQRESILPLFDRVRKSVPSMDRFRRFEEELALESPRSNLEYRWLALRQTNVRSGHVNPQSMSETYGFHRLILELVPYYLTISPIDIDYLELMFGFDLECKADHDDVVYEALFRESGIGGVVNVPGSKVLDVQPTFGVALSDKGDRQAYFEVKTRTRNRRGNANRYQHEPIGIFLTVRAYGPVSAVEDLITLSEDMSHQAEELASERLVPNLLTPIAQQITSSSA